MKKLRIATMVSARFLTPPPKGIIFAPMFVAKEINQGLTKKGHKVIYFAPEGSYLKGVKTISKGLKPLYSSTDKEPNIFKDQGPTILRDRSIRKKDKIEITDLWDQHLISLLYRENLKKKFDIIHIHLKAEFALPISCLSETPTVFTFHDPIYPWRAKIIKQLQTKNQYFVSISNAQRKSAPDLNWIKTVYNGLELEDFPFSKKAENHCLLLGRLLPRKGVYEAILIAKQAKKELIIIGTKDDKKYWDKKIKPYLGKNTKYLGVVPYEKTYQYYKKAKVFLMPISWEEPFGLVMTEAMACGTPVIAFKRGSVPEIIKHKKTGFIVNNIREAVKAVKKIDQIDRKECRKHVEENFSIKKMVDGYEKVYYDILKKKR